MWTSIGLGDKKMTTWKMYSESKPLFSDLYLVKLKRRPSLYEYEVMYYSQEHQSFGTLTSFVDPFIDGEEIEVFIPRDDIVAWESFQKIDEEHKEKNC